MISYVEIKPTADKTKNWVKGVCTSDDTKPVKGIANGSKLVELDTGKRCVYDEGHTKWIEYGTGEDRSNKPKNVKTEVYKGKLSDIFDISKMKAYWDALQAGAIATIVHDQDNVLPVMNLNILSNEEPDAEPNPIEDREYVVMAGAGMFGMGYGELMDTIRAEEYPKTFSDSSDFTVYVDDCFTTELGMSIRGAIVGLESANISWGVRPTMYFNSGEGSPTIASVNSFDNLGDFILTFYYMDEGVEPSGGAKVTTETISGPLGTIFSDNGYGEAKFTQLKEDIRTGRASARVFITSGNDFFDAQLMVFGSNSPAFTGLATAFFTPQRNGPCLKILWLWEGEELGGVNATMLLFSPNAETWIGVDDNALSQMSGQSSYDLIITRIEEE